MKVGVAGLNFKDLLSLGNDLGTNVLYVTEEKPKDFRATEAREIKVFYPRVVDEECIRCASCFAACLDRALVWTPHGGPRAIPQLCSGCKACFYACQGVTGAIKEDLQDGGTLYRSENVYVLVTTYQKMSTVFNMVIKDFDDVIFSVPADKANLLEHADKAYCLGRCEWLPYPPTSLNELKMSIKSVFRS